MQINTKQPTTTCKRTNPRRCCKVHNMAYFAKGEEQCDEAMANAYCMQHDGPADECRLEPHGPILEI